MPKTHEPRDWITELVEGLPPLLTVAEARELLRCSRRSIYNMAEDGRLTALHSDLSGSARIVIPRASIAAYLRSLQDA